MDIDPRRRGRLRIVGDSAQRHPGAAALVEPGHQRDHPGVTDGEGQIKSVSKADLSGVIIETNDSGPWGADVWWLIFGGDDQLACAFPQGAAGEKAVIDFLMLLPSFDHSEMIKAMTSTGKAVFPVWRRAA